MTEESKPNEPWLIAAWPGMGHVALSAAYYLMSKLGMHVLADLQAGELFDVDHVDVKEGVIATGRRPRNRFFAWRDPSGKHDILVFMGEAQPPIGRYVFCRKLVEFAREHNVKRVFTFAAMATQMHPEHESRVFCAATDAGSLSDLVKLEGNLEILQEGQISGLNGLLLGVAGESGLQGTCLLGEMPHIFSQIPFPKASLAVLEAFTRLAGITLDLSELAEQARVMEQQLGNLLTRIEQSMQPPEQGEEVEYGAMAEPADEPRLPPDAERRIEQLFREAAADRSKAYELKRELDRLEVFRDYEDRFLDLFKNQS